MKIASHTWARVFLIKGAYNIVVSLCLLVWANTLLPLFGTPAGNPAYTELFLVLCLAFGVGYIIVGLDINVNHGLVIIGILGQGLLFAVVALQWRAGNVYDLALISGLIDLLFALAFAYFLLQRKYVMIAAK